MIVFYFPTSTYSQKVLLTLEENEIPCQRVFVCLPMNENRSGWYLKTGHPLGKVPALRNGDEVIAGSTQIITYLNDFSSQDKCTSVTQSQITRFEKLEPLIKLEILTMGAMLHPELTENMEIPSLLRFIMARQIRGQSFESKLRNQIKECPEIKQEFADKMSHILKFETQIKDKSTIEEEIRNGKKYFDEIESILDSNSDVKWLLNDPLSAADVSLAVTLQRTRVLGLSRHMWDNAQHPNICQYYSRLLQRPSFQRVCVDGYATLPIIMAIAKSYLPKICWVSVVSLTTGVLMVVVLEQFHLGLVKLLSRR